jgi:hypothetical protein
MQLFAAVGSQDKVRWHIGLTLQMYSITKNQWKVCHQGDGCRKNGLDEEKRTLHMRRYGSDKLDVAVSVQLQRHSTKEGRKKRGREGL